MIQKANVSTLLCSVFIKGDPKVSQRDKGANRCYVNFISQNENSKLDVWEHCLLCIYARTSHESVGCVAALWTIYRVILQSQSLMNGNVVEQVESTKFLGVVDQVITGNWKTLANFQT